MPYHEDQLTQTIISCIIRVHQTLGPGFVESVYRRALLIELKSCHLTADTERQVIVHYQGQEVGRHRLDIVVESTVILELKTVEDLSRAHYAQLRSYLKATGLPLGLLVNFAKDKADFRRIEL